MLTMELIRGKQCLGPFSQSLQIGRGCHVQLFLLGGEVLIPGRGIDSFFTKLFFEGHYFFKVHQIILNMLTGLRTMAVDELVEFHL